MVRIHPPQPTNLFRMGVTSKYLTEGAALALEQCSFLLRDSVRLYDTGSFSSALVLAAFAREELGKCRDFLELAEKLDQGKVREVTLDEVKLVTTKDHVGKQERAKLSVTMRAPNDSELGKAMMHQPMSQLVKSAFKKKAQRVATDRHEQRIKALYVEPDSAGDRWNRPKDFPEDSVRDFVYDAVNDYSSFKHGIGRYHQEFAKFLEENKDEVSPLPPRWPGQTI